MMHKIAKMLKFDDTTDIDELKSFMVDQNQNFSQTFNNCLKQGIEQYLGRPINIDTDAKRLSSNHYDNGSIEYFIDGNPIGKMTVETGLDGNDFVNNKFSVVFKWIPCTTPYTT